MFNFSNIVCNFLVIGVIVSAITGSSEGTDSFSAILPDKDVTDEDKMVPFLFIYYSGCFSDYFNSAEGMKKNSSAVRTVKDKLKDKLDILSKVYIKEKNKGLLLLWNSSIYNEDCYKTFQVEMCPPRNTINVTGCLMYNATNGMTHVNNSLRLFVDNVKPGATYNFHVSLKNYSQKPYTFSKKIERTDEMTEGDPTDPTTEGDPTDSTTKSDPTDSTTKSDPTDSTTKGDPTDSTTKGDPTDSTTKDDPTDSTTKRDPTDSTTKDRTFEGNATLLNHIHELVENMKPNSSQVHGNLTISSFVTSVRDDSTNITWTDTPNNGTEVTLLEPAVHQLRNTSVRIVIVEEKNKSQCLGDIVEVFTAVPISLKRSVLQIKFERKQLSEPNNPNWTCVYWDNTTYKIPKWSDRGIKTWSDKEQEFIICSSNHLSTFSILLPDPNRILYNQNHDDDWLTLINRFGSGITICFLGLVIITNYGKKTGNESRKILMNSCFALLLTHATYQIHETLEGYHSKCLVFNFMKYYFGLVFLLWTAADGVNMWRVLLADVFNTTGYIFYRWYKIISWGMPLITTAVGLFYIDPHAECKHQIAQIYDLIFYMVPWIVILCCNMLLFTWILLNITCKNKLGRLKDKKIDCILALTQVFGISWFVVFPLLYFERTQLLGEYLLAGFITTQGPLIFIVRGDRIKIHSKKGNYPVNRRSYMKPALLNHHGKT